MPSTTARASGLLLLAVGLALPATTQAQFTYITNNGTITITGYSGPGGAVIIPNSINGLPVTSIQGYALSYFLHTFLTLTIPGSVTSIGDYAFEFNYNQPMVLFEGNAPSVGPNVFNNDNFYGLTPTAYYLPGTTGWGPTIGDAVPTKALNAITITAGPTNGLEPLTVSFTSATVDGANNTITNWNWNFGDGSTSTAQNPSYTYTTTGTFPVVLLGNINANGIPSAGAATSITVSPITVGFNASPTNGVAPLQVNFTTLTIDSGGHTITNWNWTFGDGSNGAVQNPSHTYTAPGLFSPALVATNNIGYPVIGLGPGSITVTRPTLAYTINPNNGVVPLKVNFASPGVDSGGSAITNWNWTFGDGSTGMVQNPSYTYTNAGNFPLGLIATDNIGLVVTGAGPASITVSPLVIPFTANPTNGLEPLTVNFTSQAVDNGGNSITNWNWNFGDGSTSTAQSPSHTFTNPGTFPVALFATNNIGFSVAGSGPAILVSPLTVAFTASPIIGAFPLTVNFSSGALDNGDHTITSWNWDFGDGSASTAQNPSHTYTNAGNYPLTLWATNNLGLAVIGSGPASVTVLLPVPPYTNFTVLHTFTGNDGAYPYAGLILSGNILYGTTEHSISPPNGTIFSLNNANLNFADLIKFPVFNPPGVENYDGASPEDRLVLSGNTLYGTAMLGGQAGYGNVFSVNAGTRVLTALHVFNPSGNGGVNPSSGLVLSGNTLYGTTTGGGTYGFGTVFSVSTAGSNFISLYSFTGGNDGATPLGDLIVSGNRLYGTANKGGSNGYGAVFSLSTGGANFTNLYSFTGGTDGAYPPAGGLLLLSNTLYGVANQGGTHGYGTVFSLSTNGSGFATLYTFVGGTDGAYPGASLISSGSALYGVASGGGSGGNGTIFSLNTQGPGFTTLYSFSTNNAGTNSDGANPQPGLLLSGNFLYGTARNGGSNGFGTVFLLPLPSPLPNLANSTASINNVSPHAGDTVNVSITITNEPCWAGSTSAGPFHVGFYLSTNTTFSSTSLLGEIALSGCAASATVSLGANVTIGSGETPGTYYLAYRIDDENEVAQCSGSIKYFYYWTLNVLPPLPAKPINPSPANGATGQPINTTLSWTNGGGATSYDVYFNGQFQSNQSAAIFIPGTLAYGAVYPWRIDAKNSGGTTTGDLWTFTTVDPTLGAIRQSGNFILAWPTNTVGFSLQYATNLPTTNWITVSSPVIVNGQYMVTNSTSGKETFFRLSR